MSRSKIIVIGSLNMDLVVTSPKIPVLGETVLGSGFMTVPGGKGANQAVAVAKLNGDVAMIGCIGNDTFGKILIKNLSASKVKVDNIKVVDSVSTGIAMVVVKDGDNFIIVDPGANSELKPDDIIALEQAIQESSMVVIQLEIPLETVETAIELANRHAVKVLLNPAPAKKLSDELLSKVDIFTPNESECEIITGLPAKSIEDAKAAALYLNEKGIHNVLITLGGKGVVYNNGDQIIHKTVPEVEVVDTTAAGDSFSGAIAVALTEGMELDAAVDFANIVGTLAVTKKGAQASLPDRNAVMEFMKTGTVVK